MLEKEEIISLIEKRKKEKDTFNETIKRYILGKTLRYQTHKSNNDFILIIVAIFTNVFNFYSVALTQNLLLALPASFLGLYIVIRLRGFSTSKLNSTTLLFCILSIVGPFIYLYF